MITRFGTFENASFFVATKRGEGHYAEILDEGAGFLYGPMVSSGFRVIVSEQALLEDEEPPIEIPKTDSTFDNVVRNTVLVVLSTAGFIACISFLKAFQHSQATFPMALIQAIVGIALGSCIAAYVSALARE